MKTSKNHNLFIFIGTANLSIKSSFKALKPVPLDYPLFKIRILRIISIEAPSSIFLKFKGALLILD